MTLLPVAACPARTDAPPELRGWLDHHPRVRDEIRWESAQAPLRFPEWPPALQQALVQAFSRAWKKESLNLSRTPSNLSPQAEDERIRQILSAEDAQSLYLSYVARSLAMEIDRRLPWSLEDYPRELLSVLFDSREFFERSPEGYVINPWQAGMILPSAPDDVFSFMESRIGKDRLETIGSVLEWARGLVHFEGVPTARNMEDQWQYRGYPPIERVLSGTMYIGRGDPSLVHRTAGCQGTAGFLRAVLRSVNIPTKIVRVCRHALVSFPSENKYLSHGDDPYHLRALSSGCSAKELLIDGQIFAAWFDSGPPEDRCRNVGRAVREIPMKGCHAR